MSTSGIRFALVAIAGLGLVAVAPASAQTLLPATAYTAPAQYRSAVISPDGGHIAIMQERDGGDRLVVLALGQKGAKARAFNFDKGEAYNARWADNNKLVVQYYGRFNNASSPSVRAFVVDLDTSDPPALVKYQPNVGFTRGYNPYAADLRDVVDLLPKDPDHVLMSAEIVRTRAAMQTLIANGSVYLFRDLVRVNTNTGVAVPFKAGGQYTAKWLSDGKGNVVARVDILASGRQSILVPDGDQFREVAALDDQGQNGGDIEGISPDGTAVVVKARRNEHWGLYPIDLKTGTWGDPLFLSPDFDIDGVTQDVRTLRVSGVTYKDGTVTRTHYFDPAWQALETTFEKLFKGQSISILSESDDGNKVLIEVRAPGRPPTLGLFDRTQKRIDTVLASRPALAKAAFGVVSAHSYTTADGSTITGVLTLPPKGPKTNLPAVVLEPADESPTFDPLAQFLASRGYAVFRPGLRQITTIDDVYGMDRLGNWIQQEQEDIDTGVKDLIAKGVTDPKRVCTLGHGDLAYMTLMSTIETPDLFACAISVNGIVDLRRMVNFAKFLNLFQVNSYNSALIRNYKYYAPKDLAKYSPEVHVDAIKAPILLIGYHAKTNTETVQMDDLASMEDALRAAGKNVTFAAFKNDLNNPSLNRAENRNIEFDAIAKFLKAKIGP